jgi:predicted alpha/beta superfamily hydrolase
MILLMTKFWLGLLGCNPLQGDIIYSEVHFPEQHTNYELNVYLPPNYSAGDDFPWILMLDGDVGFGDAAELVENEISQGSKEVVLVGIGQQESRSRDYTPSVNSEENMSGGLDDFFSFLDDTVIPLVEEEYRVGEGRSYRSITGHSYGGLATLWAMYYRQEVYHAYGATSPAIWWDRGIPFDWERMYAAENQDLDATVYLSMGQLEVTPMNPLFNLFVTDLQQRNYPNLNLKSEELYGHEHYSAWEPGMQGFVQFVYGTSQ